MSLRYVDPNEAILASMSNDVVGPSDSVQRAAVRKAVVEPTQQDLVRRLYGRCLPGRICGLGAAEMVPGMDGAWCGTVARPGQACVSIGDGLCIDPTSIRVNGLGRLAALGEEPRTAQIPGFARPVSGPTPNPDTFRQVKLSPGARGTTETLRVMADLAVEASQDPYFVQFARGVVRECGSRDHLCEANAILNWVKSNVTYRYDSRYLEYVSSPAWTAFVDGVEDCDGQATLIAAMALSVGLEAMFRAVALDRSQPDEFSHVYCMIGVPGRGFLGADSIVPEPKLGWEPPRELWVMAPNDLLVTER